MKNFWQRLVLFGLTGAFFVSCISCSAANTASKVPILMYHNLTNDPSAVTSMTITGERFQEDMEYLEYNGYTPLLSADLINIRAGKESMPERPVMITFDDGYRSNYDIAYPILQKTGMKAVIALIGKSIRANDNTEANRFFLKWDEAAEMADSGLVELASHTYNLHNPQYGGLTAPDGINGIQRLKGESQAAYNKRVGEDLKQSIDLITQNTNQKNVLFFAYPFGARDGWMQPLLQKNGIQVSVLTNTGTASIRRRLTDLPRYRITMDTKLSDILPANPNASHDITVRAHMPTMIKNEKIRQEVARHLPAQERTIKIPKIVYLIFQGQYRIIKQERFASKFYGLTRRGFAVILDRTAAKSQQSQGMKKISAKRRSFNCAVLPKHCL